MAAVDDADSAEAGGVPVKLTLLARIDRWINACDMLARSSLGYAEALRSDKPSVQE